MYLKALEIQGFKSFPEKTRLSFEKDITVIVGPNGSGKSNISDALLWVMGEQKTRMLRGGKMEDVIFGGTEKRGAMGFAQVTLVLDNTSRVLQRDTDEVSISRRYYRSGDSEYYINREQVRLRDVTELLMDTGLGCDGYSIIGQGRISEIVSAKSTDRREIFEEAAGISRFRHRKEESERKLQRTEENLIRIGDKISELELQVGPLKSQSEVAQKYLLLRDELRVHEVSLWMSTLDKLRDQTELLRADYEEANHLCTAARSEQERLYAESERLAERMHDSDVRAEEMREALRTTESAAAEQESAAAVTRTNIKNNDDTLERLKRELTEQSDRADSLLRQIGEHKVRISAIEDERRALTERGNALRRREQENTAVMDENTCRLTALAAREGELSASLAENRATVSMLEEGREGAEERKKAALAEQEAAEAKLTEAEGQLAEARRALASAREQSQSLQNVIDGHVMLMGGRERKVADLTERRTKLTVELRSCDSRIQMLSELEREMEGFSKATKVVMRESARGTLRGIHGPVGKMIRTEDRYALAVETALGGAVGDILVDTQNDGKAAIEYLKKHDVGRATFRALDTMRLSRLGDEPKGEEGYIGIASELVSSDAKYENVISGLLGRTAVAETLSDAIRIAKRHNHSFRIVTLDGQLINAGGSMTGGSAARGTGLLSRANELTRLKTEREKTERELSTVGAELQEAERSLAAARYDLETARAEVSNAGQDCARLEGEVARVNLLCTTAEEALDALEEEQRTSEQRRRENESRMDALKAAIGEAECELTELRKTMENENKGLESIRARRAELEESLSALRAGEASLVAERTTVELAIGQLEELRAQAEGDSGERKNAMILVESRRAELEDGLALCEERLGVLRRQIETQKTALSELTQRRMELEGRRSAADKAAQEKNRELLELERKSAALESKKLAADMEEKQIVDKLWESYELSRTEAQTVRQPIESMAKEGRTVAELRRSMSALGTPNLGAIEEYKRVSERYEFLSGQRDDVETSKKEILQIIADITGEMEEIFRREMVQIDEAFRQIFVELFGGGKASVTLEDNDHVLDCGIDIRIQPPGKAVSNISLLSGGEKAFVAIALYFAIMRVRPTPFCVMDEIESALDEENVERYASYMRRMCGKTQFIAITHRRGTMDEADQLYGVTMQEKGVSTVISMDMDEALKTVG